MPSNSYGIRLVVIDDTPEPDIPDSFYPNNFIINIINIIIHPLRRVQCPAATCICGLYRGPEAKSGDMGCERSISGLWW